MHLAFDRFGLEHHPDAELCAVGSPVFDELLGLLRMRGDMHATVPVIPADIGPSPYRHTSTIRLVRRRLIPSNSWSGQATFRATVGEAETTEHLITADINGHSQQRLARRPLQDGETLPPAFGTPSKVIAQFERAAASQLESLRRGRAKQVESDQRRELDRITKGYTAQIAEAAGEDRARLRRALSSEERRLGRAPDVRARAKVLAVTLDEDDWLVEETWAGPSGDEGMLTYEWGDAEPPIVESDASAEPIRVLALCSSMHWVDESETSHCGSCASELCSECGDDAVFVGCAVCGLASCGICRSETGGLCRRCASPSRAPELDTEFGLAWTLNAGTVLVVGQRVAELMRPGVDGTSVIIPDADVADSIRSRMRSYARSKGLPMDCGLAFRDLTGRSESGADDRARLKSSAVISVELSVTDSPAASIDMRAIDDIPMSSDVAVAVESHFRLEAVLQKIRSETPPIPAPAVLVTRRSTFEDFYLEPQGLLREVTSVADDGSLITTDAQAAQFDWHRPTVDDALLAEAEIGDLRVKLQRRNDAVLVTASPPNEIDVAGQWIACPENLSGAEQLASFEYLSSLGMPGGRLGKRAREILTIVRPFPSPTECDLVERTVRQVADRIELDSDDEVVAADSESLAAIGLVPNSAVAEGISDLPPALSHALLDQAKRSFTTALCNGLEVAEVWRGYGSATHTYRTFDGEALTPILDDLGFRETDFGVCRDGHFYSVGTAARCASCDTWACRACDEQDAQASIVCRGCAHGVCRRCLSTDHAVPNARCRSCNDHACHDCGRDPNVSACPACEREMCVSCRTGDLCTACSGLRPITQDELVAFPQGLAAEGATIFAGRDDDAMVAILNRGNAYEQAIIRNGSIDRWVAFGRSEIDPSYRLRLSASRSLNRQVVPVVESLSPEIQRHDPRVVVQSERAFYPSWSVAELNASGRGAVSFAEPDHDLASVIADEFGALAQLPEAVVALPHHLKSLVESMHDPSPVDVVLSWQRRGRDVAIGSDGIIEVNLEGAALHEAFSNWSENQSILPWVADEWNPVPMVRRYAVTRGVEAAIVNMASMLALGVRTAEGITWFVVTASEQAPAATTLSRSMNLGDADEVAVYSDPKKIRLSTVSNAVASALNFTPVGEVRTGPRNQDRITLDALAAWAPTATVVAPHLEILPHELRVGLEQQARPATPRSRLEIGALVEKLVTVEGGQEWRYETRLAPGQTDARRNDKSTRHPLDSGVIDREGHFGVAGLGCGYCGARICSACVDGIVACDCCSTSICKRCVTRPHDSLWLCPACISTRPPTRSEARDHGRVLMTRGMLIGSDALHTVVVEHSKSRWIRHGQDGEKNAIANPSVTKFLEERLTGG